MGSPKLALAFPYSPSVSLLVANDVPPFPDGWPRSIAMLGGDSTSSELSYSPSPLPKAIESPPCVHRVLSLVGSWIIYHPEINIRPFSSSN